MPQSQGQQKREKEAGFGFVNFLTQILKGESGEVTATGQGSQGAGAGEEERHAVLTYVLTALDEHLLTELLEGFPSEK
jgi:hypothetical protein